MTHRIFVSKGTLDLGRNRNQRILEAQLDRQETKLENEDSKKILNLIESDSSPASLERFEEETLDKIDKEIKEENICIYYDVCHLYRYSMKCIFGKDNCRTKIFYDRYKDFDYGRQMGI